MQQLLKEQTRLNQNLNCLSTISTPFQLFQKQSQLQKCCLMRSWKRAVDSVAGWRGYFLQTEVEQMLVQVSMMVLDLNRTYLYFAEEFQSGESNLFLG